MCYTLYTGSKSLLRCACVRDEVAPFCTAEGEPLFIHTNERSNGCVCNVYVVFSTAPIVFRPFARSEDVYPLRARLLNKVSGLFRAPSETFHLVRQNRTRASPAFVVVVSLGTRKFLRLAADSFCRRSRVFGASSSVSLVSLESFVFRLVAHLVGFFITEYRVARGKNFRRVHARASRDARLASGVLFK